MRRRGVLSRRPRFRGALVAGLALCVAVLGAAEARAEVATPRQGTAGGAGWLAHVPDSHAPPERAAVCLVDTGAEETPDTRDALAARVSYYDGSGGDSSGHGTLMAMTMGARANGWGMVGLWNRARVVSVRATYEPQGLTYVGLYRGMTRCRELADTYRIKVIELALGDREPTGTTTDRAALEDLVGGARRDGLNVVAAAGNRPGPATSPASYGPVLAVGASSAERQRCSFSAYGGVDLYAPGCDLDEADPRTGAEQTGSGTSQASAYAAAALAALRSYRPGLSHDEAERALRETASAGVIDLAAAFRREGLGDVVSAGQAASPRLREPEERREDDDTSDEGSTASSGGNGSSSGEESSPPTSTVPLSPVLRHRRPAVRLLGFRRGVMDLRVVGIARGGRVVVRFFAFAGEFGRRQLGRTVVSGKPLLRLRPPRGWEWGEIHAIASGRAASEATVIRRPGGRGR